MTDPPRRGTSTKRPKASASAMPMGRPGAGGDSGILVVHGASRDFNASLPKAVVDRALARNPIAARAEYLAEFRSDLEGYVSLDTLRACTGPLTERQPMPDVRYTAGLDLASGSGEDSLALAICQPRRSIRQDKESMDRRFNQACRPSVTPSSS
jgi:hypothetical protein